MPTKSDLTIAAIVTLRQKGVDPTLEAVQKMVKSTSGEDISGPTYYQAKAKMRAVAETTKPEPSTPTLTKTDPVEAPFSIDAFLSATEIARQLLALLNGDKEAAIKLLRSI